MEERVRVCKQCNSIVGWFAHFCEACGADQEQHGARRLTPVPGGGPPSAQAAVAASKPAPGVSKPSTPAPPQPTLEAEIRKHLVAPPTDARAVARDLFQTQLKLIHRHREGVETLISDVEAMKRELSSAGRGKTRDQIRRSMDDLSQRMFDAEQRWGELQVSYNRDSEAIEEESRESMETADVDAYLSPDENAKVEGEYAELASRFETVDALLRDTGRAIALMRQEANSRYSGRGPLGGGPRLVLLFVTAALVGWSMYSALFQYREDPLRVAQTVGPVLLALGMWVVHGFSTRRSA